MLKLVTAGFVCMLALAAHGGAQSKKMAAMPSVVPKDPFVTNNGLIPKPGEYNGPLFKLSNHWPAKQLPPITNPPWSAAIGGGPITPSNAGKYVDALKAYVAPNARKLFLDPNWDAAAAHWYTEPWLGSIREAIKGTYAAGQFDSSSFPGTGLKTTFDTHVVTYYDERAAFTLTKVWGESALKPNVTTQSFQFPEGSVVVKAAIFLSDDPNVQSNWWPVTDGAAKWPLYLAIPESKPGATKVLYGYVMQFDIIVKDSASAPKTGWVFSTLVYDQNAPGKDPWDKMVSLGAMWGNDPQANSALNPPPPLLENWINPKAPKYSTQTLGWGGRLSGPNDGARNDIQVGEQIMRNAPDSSCMSCHSPAEWQPEQHKMLSFLLPSFQNPSPPPPFKPCSQNTICSPASGSPEWMRWFQSRPGTEPMDKGSVATDYDMVFAFKTLPMWWAAMGPAGQPAPFTLRTLTHGALTPKQYNEYSGAPLKTAPAKK